MKRNNILRQGSAQVLLISSALSLIAFSGCTETEEFQYNPDSALQIESVSGISPFALMQEPSTRAVITGENLPADEAAKGIGLFVTASNGGAYDGKTSGYSNVNYTYSASKWNTATPVYLSNTTGKLYGYFPYSTGATNLTAVPVESSLNGTDYLYATPQDVSFSNKSVNLTMNHALARLHLTIKKGDKYLSDCKLTKIVLQSKAIDANGTMNITTGAVTATKAADATGTVELTGDDAVTAAGITKDILLVPADNSEGEKDLTLILTIDGAEAKVNFTGGSGLDIRQGIQCNATLTIEDTGIKLEGVEVGEWCDGRKQTVEVNGYTVTVKFAEEQLPEVANDVLLGSVKVENKKVIIEAFSKSQKRLECYLDGEATCNMTKYPIIQYKAGVYQERVDVHTCNISDIATDITVTIGYPRPTELHMLSSHTAYVGYPFKVNPTLKPDDVYNNFTWSSSDTSVATVDENGRVMPLSVGNTNITFSNGLFEKSCIVTVKSDEELILPGIFSLDLGGKKKVQFSSGNLKYMSDVESWCFFDKQYEHGHSSNQISLFCWGYNHLSTVWDQIHLDEIFTDWGTQVGDGNTWRTLTQQEWFSLINNTESKVGLATVCGMHGLLLLPDEFEDPKTNESNSSACVEKKFVPKSSTGWEQNIYSQGDSWNKMEVAGAVFLPAAGKREHMGKFLAIGDIGVACFYWSSTPDKDEMFGAYSTEIVSEVLGASSSHYRGDGHSVRLVKDVK